MAIITFSRLLATFAMIQVASAASVLRSTGVHDEVAASTADRLLQTYTDGDDFQALMLKAVNAERSKAGLESLCTNAKLQAAAQGHSDDMASEDFMSHEGSDGSTMSERVTAQDYNWTALAENVAAGQVDVDAVMDSWMDSPGHKVNILDATYTQFGTGYAYNEDSEYKHYWTQNFGASSTDPCSSSTPTIDNASVLPGSNIYLTVAFAVALVIQAAV